MTVYYYILYIHYDDPDGNEMVTPYAIIEGANTKRRYREQLIQQGWKPEELEFKRVNNFVIYNPSDLNQKIWQL